MPVTTRTFRVFVSSTFEDLKAERDALQRDVFPMLRKLCEENGARFQAIDLRWGVRDEAALDQQTMEICLREIERCQQTGIKPNFIGLLGERYGWRPVPARIEAEEFKNVCGRVTDADKRLIDDWYQCDENAVPPEFLLKPRTGEFVHKDHWAEVEQKLHRILREAARAAGLAPESLITYEASATHQEILKGLGESAEDRKHVFAFFREPIEGVSVDPEIEALKEDLRQKLPEGNVQPFRIGEVEKLCKDVEESLKKVILDETSRFTSRDPLELEIEAHDRFAEERSRIFVGRADALTAIANYLNGPERRPLVLRGESGSGKSAVMARASEQYKGPGRLIRRFIGASPESASGHTLLTSLCKQIAPGEMPVDYYQLEKTFQERLVGVTAEKPLVLFIDALDQLTASDPARTANWLPAELPPHVKVIVSTTDDEEQLPSSLQLRFDRMTTREGRQALDLLLRGTEPREVTRTLRPWQRDRVLEHFERCGLPLYLKLAAVESRPWKSFSLPDACKLGEGIEGVLDTLFDRLASNANHGPVLVERSLGYLTAARYGLTEEEMLDVLAADDAVWNDFDKRKHHEVSERRLPVVAWSRLSLDLEPYLTEHAAPGGTVIAFYHRQLAERVASKYLAGAETQARHADMARYFSARPAWLDQGQKTPDARRAAELAFQQREARQWKDAEKTLFDCPFLFAKVTATMVLDLDADYRTLLTDAPPASLNDRIAVELTHGALRLSMHVVARDSMQFASQMVGRLLSYEETPAIKTLIDEIVIGAPRPWLRPLHPALQRPGGPLIRTLEGHSGGVECVAVYGEGRRAVSASQDQTLMVWDLESGRVLQTLKGHSDCVTAIAVYADGRRAISASEDNTLKVWDLDSGRLVETLVGHACAVDGVAVYADGLRAISASRDKTLKVWDLESGRVLQTLKGHSDCVTAIAVYADGRRAISASFDQTLMVWDLEKGRAVRTLKGHAEFVNAVSVYAEGRRAISASADNTLKVWDLGSGRAVQTLEGHSDSVWAVSVYTEGRRAISVSFKTLKVWDLESGRVVQTLEGHSDVLTSVSVYAEGRRAISTSQDRTLKVWDLESGREMRTAEGHSDWVLDVAVAAKGRRAVSVSGDKKLKVWDLQSGRLVRTLEGYSCVAVNVEGTRAISASADNTLKVWDLDSGRVVQDLEGHSKVTTVAMYAEGRRAISASEDKALRIWDLESGRLVETLEGHSSRVMGIAVYAGDRRLLTASEEMNKALMVWDLESARVVQILEGHSEYVESVAVYAKGRRAVSGSFDKTVKVWDLERGRVMLTLKGHSRWVRGVAVNAEGRRAISTSDDRTLNVWDLGSGALVATFTCDAEAECCAFIDVRRIITGDRLGGIHWLELVE